MFFLVLVLRLLTCLVLVDLRAWLLSAKRARAKFVTLALSARAKKKSILALDAFSPICYNSISSNDRDSLTWLLYQRVSVCGLVSVLREMAIFSSCVTTNFHPFLTMPTNVI